MALTASEVRVAISGELHVAPVGTTAPETVDEALASAFVGLGYVSDDGVTESYEESVENIAAWQNGSIVRKVTTESEATFQLTLIQSNRQTLELFHKTSMMTGNEEDGYRLRVRTPGADPRSFVFDVLDGEDHIRIWVPRGEVTERGEVTYNSTEAIGYDVTITAYPEPLGFGVTGPMIKMSKSLGWGDES